MSVKNRVLVIFAHPYHDASRINRTLRSAIENLPGVTMHDLYEKYPDFFIDPQAEQALLLEHQVVVFQHPFYWYHCPALLKEWLDIVLEHGWAYGPGGDKLHGKYFLQAISAGGPVASYQPDGHNHFSIHELLRPFEQSAHLCGMIYLPPFVSYGARVITNEELTTQQQRYAGLIQQLVADDMPPAFHTIAKTG